MARIAAMVAAGCLVLTLGPGQVLAQDPAAPPLPDWIDEPLEGGRHVRFVTDDGPVHLWVPAGFRSERAGIALYVHGYFTDVDTAWTEHRLAEQFRMSGRNALFIVPEAPNGGNQAVHFPDLDLLIATVRERVRVAKPWGPVVALAHSGGYRTIMAWLHSPVLDQVILLDGLYGNEDEFWQFARRKEPSSGVPLIVLGADTVRWTEPFAKMAKTVVAVREFDRVPDRSFEVDVAARAVSLLYFRAQFGHMEMVEQPVAIPVLYGVSRLGPRFPPPAPVSSPSSQ